MATFIEMANRKLSMGPDMLYNAHQAVRFLAMACGFEKEYAMMLLGVENLPIGNIGVNEGFNHGKGQVSTTG